jgi:hypothetical protein
VGTTIATSTFDTVNAIACPNTLRPYLSTQVDCPSARKRLSGTMTYMTSAGALLANTRPQHLSLYKQLNALGKA